jgi:Raf kinase inhibitor-like YbhB/YbcL family protein
VDVIGFVLAGLAFAVAVGIWLKWASTAKSIRAEKSELETKLNQLEVRRRKTEARLSEITKRAETLKAELSEAEARRDEKAIARAIWSLELDRIERQWRDVVVPAIAESTDSEDVARKSVGAQLAFAVACEVERLREEVGVSIRYSGELFLDMEPETALGALRIAQELLAVCAKQADTIEVKVSSDEDPSAVVSVACTGWDGPVGLDSSDFALEIKSMAKSLEGWARFEQPDVESLQVSVKLPAGTTKSMTTMDMKTSAFSDHALMPPRFAKEEDNVSPELRWDEAPTGTAELVLTCEDPDAPNGTFIHWLVAGIEPSTTGSDEGKSPVGSIEGTNDYGEVGYGGPRPPVGDDPHRYFFRVHACSKALNLKEGFTNEQLRRSLAECEIATGTVVGTYQR